MSPQGSSNGTVPLNNKIYRSRSKSAAKSRPLNETARMKSIILDQENHIFNDLDIETQPSAMTIYRVSSIKNQI